MIKITDPLACPALLDRLSRTELDMSGGLDRTDWTTPLSLERVSCPVVRRGYQLTIASHPVPRTSGHLSDGALAFRDATPQVEIGGEA